MNREAKIKKILGVCDRTLGVRRKIPKMPPLETAAHALFAPGNRDEEAAAALKALLVEFVDWNEVRVSSWKEIGSALEASGIRDPGEKAIALKKLLEAVFNRFNKMSLDALLAQKPEDAHRTLEAMPDIPDTAAGAILHNNLGNDSLHATPGLLRIARRIGLVREGASVQIKKDLEAFVPRKERFRFQQHLGHLAQKVCLAGVTLCPRCPLNGTCPSGVLFMKKAEEIPVLGKSRASSRRAAKPETQAPLASTRAKAAVTAPARKGSAASPPPAAAGHRSGAKAGTAPK